MSSARETALRALWGADESLDRTALGDTAFLVMWCKMRESSARETAPMALWGADEFLDGVNFGCRLTLQRPSSPSGDPQPDTGAPNDRGDVPGSHPGDAG